MKKKSGSIKVGNFRLYFFAYTIKGKRHSIVERNYSGIFQPGFLLLILGMFVYALAGYGSDVQSKIERQHKFYFETSKSEMIADSIGMSIDWSK